MRSTYLANTMIIPLEHTSEWFNPQEEDIERFKSTQEVESAIYSLFSWLGKCGLPIGYTLYSYEPIKDKRLQYIEELVWDYYWHYTAQKTIDYITVQKHNKQLHIHYHTRGL